MKLFDEPGGKNAFEMCHSFLYFISLVCISEFLYANFLSTCIQCTHVLKSWWNAGTCNIHIQLGQPICTKINQNLNLDESKSKFKYFVDSINEGF